MTITVDHDSRVSRVLKLRRAVSLPIYVLALILSFLSDGLSNLAAVIAQDTH